MVVAISLKVYNSSNCNYLIFLIIQLQLLDFLEQFMSCALGI